MSFFDELWKKFKTNPKTISSTISEPDNQSSLQSKEAKTKHTDLLQNIQDILNAFEHQEKELQDSHHLKKNLSDLKKIVDEPKGNPNNNKADLELRFSKINQHLGPSECHETVRQERWQPNIHCPDCQSGHLKRLTQLSNQSPYKHRYRCLDCGLVFNDDSGTPLENNIPPLNIWMQCWYLMGITDSLSYIASKLNLDLGTIEFMAEQLRILFKANHPLTKFIDYDEWKKKSVHLREQLKEDLLKQYERLSADIATIPKDTAEFRRQQNLRRDLVSSTEPPSGGRKR